ncbi:MAG: acyl carrier protein [Steroidobacteraceae bacterium]
MNREELTALVLKELKQVAPNVDTAGLEPSLSFRDQFDFDSMDTLNLAIGLHRTLGIDIPELDYGQLASLDRAVDYLERHLRRA